ncbi:UNVERIFIED_CONTAM: hypothetical protein FKN15_031130 [Acipenser sinensis]
MIDDWGLTSDLHKVRLLSLTFVDTVQEWASTLSAEIRKNFEKLCTALTGKYSKYGDPCTALHTACLRQCKKDEDPTDFYKELKRLYYASDAHPGDNVDKGFKLLFICNLSAEVRVAINTVVNADDSMPTILEAAESMVKYTDTRPNTSSTRVLGDEAEPDFPGSERNELPQNSQRKYQLSHSKPQPRGKGKPDSPTPHQSGETVF